ncbi:tenascin isoform X1 [Scomber scombrus]|uniref:Tenascin isoform X1 n=1 Tax=Scomber scombrus TaxID=13677 RepID=A0AAV1QCM0_SCOSC
MTSSASQEIEVRGHRTPRDTKQDTIKVVISEGCTHGDSSDGSQGGKEIDLVPGAPLVLTHKIKLVPSGFGSGSGSCGCEADFAALRERLERLEREVSALREKCGGPEGGCCTSKESKGAGCSMKPKIDECPNECSDQGRCVDGKCVCFPGFSGPDCSDSNCPGNCNDKGRCVNGQCVCDPGFSGPDCSQRGCPDNCNNRGRCVNGKCVCDSGFTGPSCSDESCPGNCNNKGRCVNGQCVCNPGFTGPDCSKKACPDNCNNRGRCVNGKCVCDSGYTGADCSEISCPGNCNNRGRCVNGQCVCNDGFTGLDCSERTCPNNCNDRGRCVNGKCVCDSSFTGDDCSENSCPGNCNNKGRCVNGQCVCNDGFTGHDCSEKACPNNCSNRGKCVNGKCVCDVGFAGPDCAAKGCPSNCNNKGRCVKGKCVCRRGFTGPDCSQCEEGMTGPNCDTAMSGVPQLNTREITSTSVTLIWTPPPVQYDIYHITFTSQKESDQKITVQVEGSLTTFTQTGLAAGQEYIVSITGEIGGRRGAESSTEFTTLISGPTNLHVVKTTSTSAVVQWEQSQGEIDRYRMTVSPKDGVGKSQEMTFPPGRDSAHIQQLEAGRLYDITLVAEKGRSQSEPTSTQAVPGKTLPKVTMAAATTQVTPAPGQEDGDRDQELNTSSENQDFDQKRRKEDGTDSVKDGGVIGLNRDHSATVIARTKPLVSRKDGAKPVLAERPALSGKPNVPNFLRFNASRVGPGGRKVGPGTNPLQGERKKLFLAKRPRLLGPTVRDRTPEDTALTVRDPSVDASSTERREDKNSAIMSGTDSGTNSEEPTVAPGTQKQPDVGTEVQRGDADPVSSEPTGAGQSHEKKWESNEADIATDESTPSLASPEDRKVPPRESGIPVFRRTHPKRRPPHQNIRHFLNRTRLNLKAPYHSGSPLNLIPTRATETRHTPASELSLSPSSSAPEESSSVEVNAPVSDTSADKDEATTLTSSRAEENQKKTPTKGGILPFRRLPPIWGNRRRPNGGPFQNQTQPKSPKLRVQTRPTQPLNHAMESGTDPISPNESPAPSSPPSSTKEKSYPTEGTGSGVEDTEGNVGGHLPDGANGVPSSDLPTSRGTHSRRTNLYVGPFQNRNRTNLRPPHRKPNGNVGIRGGQTLQSAKENTPEVPVDPSGEQGDSRPTQEVKIRQSDPVGDNDLTQTIKSGEEETQTPESNSDSGIHKERVNAAKNTGTAIQGRPVIKQKITLPKRQPPTRRITAHSTPMRNIGGSHRVGDPKANHTAKHEFDSKTEQTGSDSSKSPKESDVSSSGVKREPLDYVGVTNQTSDGFTVIWDAPEGKYKNFVVTKKESGKDEEPKEEESRKELEEEDSEKEDGKEDAENRNTENENRVLESVGTQIPTIQSIKEVKPATESDKIVLPGSARSFQFEDLPPQKEYTVTLLGKGPGLLSRLHKLVISTGPEPPTDITFSKVTETSLTVSWTKPNTPVSGFKITYTHTEEGEPVSVSVDSNNSSLGLSELSPGSSYEVNVISILGLDESDPIRESVRTRPDAPTDLKAINVTDTKALLLWRPALAAIDKYTIVYSSGKDSPLTITVSGNAAEQQLSGLEGSTTYTVTITSELGSQKSSAATTSFTTDSGSGKLRDLMASQVTPRTAVLTWKPPSKLLGSYKLTYQTEGGEMKEVIVDASVREYKLTKLHPGSKYNVQLQMEGGGGSISTDFTTGTLRFPFPTDCSQELLNGITTSGEVEIFPHGKLGAPMMVYCDMETDGGGWTVLQRRKDGSVDFFKGWKEYVKGFGDLSGEFWLGLDSLHNLTTMTKMNLRVDMRDGDESVYAKYSTFEVAKRNYRLTVGGYSGTAGDSFSYHNNRVFSTKDRDPAPFITRCAMSYRGGWWYKNCHEANLNGLYGIDVKHQGVIWTSWKGKEFSIPFTEMKMRPAAFSPPTRG